MEILVTLLLLFSSLAQAQGEPAPAVVASPTDAPVELNDVLLLSHPLGPMVRLKYQVLDAGNAQTSDAGGFRPQPVVQITREEIRVALAPCHLDSALKKRFKTTPLQLTLENNWVLKGFLEAEKDRCELLLATPVGFFNFSEKNQKEAGEITFQGFFTATDEKIARFETEYWNALGQSENQPALRAAAGELAKYAHNPYVKQFFLSGLKEGQFSQVLSLTSGLCMASRHEFFPEVQRLNLVEQLTGTPDETWMKDCMKTLQVFYALDPQLEAERKSLNLPASPFTLKDLEPYLFYGGRQGQWVDAFIRDMPIDLNDAEKNRRAVLLALKARQKGVFAEVVEWTQKANLSKKAKPLVFEFLRVAAGAEAGESGFKTEHFSVNAVSLQFMRAEALSKTKSEAQAKAIYETLATLPPRVMYEHVEGREKFFALPAATYAEGLLALSLFKLGEKNVACQTWVDLAWKNAKGLFSGFEFEESLCKYHLQFVQDYCPKEIPQLKDREARFLKTPAACLGAWQKVFRTETSSK